MDDVATATIILLKDYINYEIQQLNSYTYSVDEKAAQRLDQDFVHYDLEEVKPANLETGEGKDIVDEAFDITDEFPRINVIVSQAQDSGAGGDHMAIYNVSLAIECWVKAEPSEGPQMAYKRASRIIEAVHRVMLRDPTLNGLVLHLDNSPQAAISPIIRKDLQTPNVNLDTQYHQDVFNGYYLCGGGVQYTIRKNSSLQV